MTVTTKPEIKQSLQLAKQQKPLSNFMQRLISGLILLPAIIAMVWSGGWLLFAGAAALMIVGLLEFFHLALPTHRRAYQAIGLLMGLSILLAFQLQMGIFWQVGMISGTLALLIIPRFLQTPLTWSKHGQYVARTLGGLLLVAVPAGFALGIRQAPDGLMWLVAAIVATWSVDIAAYAVGRMIGKTPFLPQISPNKTLEGAMGGVVAGLIFPWIPLLSLASLSVSVVMLVVIAPFVAIWGDSFESWMKRRANMKDSGLPYLNLIPGHGGILDRIDALVWVLMLFYGYLVLSGLVQLPL